MESVLLRPVCRVRRIFTLSVPSNSASLGTFQNCIPTAMEFPSGSANVDYIPFVIPTINCDVEDTLVTPRELKNLENAEERAETSSALSLNVHSNGHLSLMLEEAVDSRAPESASDTAHTPSDAILSPPLIDSVALKRSLLARLAAINQLLELERNKFTAMYNSS